MNDDGTLFMIFVFYVYFMSLLNILAFSAGG